MSQPINVAPKDGSIILIEDDASGAHDVASWSPEAETWLDKNGEPSKITASHWLPIPSETWSKASAAPDHGPRGLRDRFAILATVALLVAGFAAAPFHHQINAFLTRLPGVHDTFREGSPPTQPVISKRQSKADQAVTQTAAADAVMARGPATALLADAPQALQFDDQFRRALDLERERNAALAHELAVMRRETEARAAQLRRVANDSKLQEQAAAGTISALRQSLQQERDKAALLQKETSALRQAMLGDAEQHRVELDEERGRRAALLSELAEAQREIETTQLRKRSEERGQPEQADAGARPRLLEEDREKTVAFTPEAADAQQELITSTTKAFGAERERGAVVASELAAEQREVETQAAQLRKATEPLQGQAEATESASLLKQEREKTTAVAPENGQGLDTSSAQRQGSPTEARLDTEMESVQSRKANEETRQAEEAEAAASARLLEEKRERTAALAQEAADARQELQHHQALKPARRLAMGGNELATQRSSPVAKNPPRLNRGRVARQTWPLLWLLGLDPRWQRTMHASVFGLPPFR